MTFFFLVYGYSFNPRAREGRDIGFDRQPISIGSFQSTRPRGARHECSNDKRILEPCFNPRAREGRDERCQFIEEHVSVSIHAPARGATWYYKHKRV